MKTQYAKMKSFMAKHAVRKSIDDLKEESEALYLERLNKENALVQAYNDKKLKSKTVIRRARAIINQRNTASEKKNAE